MTRYLIGIDNGSQSSKVSVFDESGRVVCEGRQPLLPYDTPRPGVVEHPDDDIWSSIGAASRQAMARFPGDPGDIAGVGLCTIRFCRALLRADGSLAAPVMSWMDERVALPHETSLPEVAWITTSSGYVTARMTGSFKDTAANYQGMWPISTARWQWLRDDEGFAAACMPRDQLFELVLPGEVVGSVTEAASAHTGIPAGVPVVATANDKAVEALGCGLRSPHSLLVSLGTYIAGMVTGEDERSGTSFWSNFASIPHRYLYESGGIRRGMWTVSWWRDLLGADARIPAAERGVPVEAYLDERAAALVPAGSDGLMVALDWLAPAEAPFRKGSILGFDARHGSYHVHRAILEGIALTLRRHTEAMAGELQRRYDELLVTGGGAASELLVRILADVFGLPALRCGVRDAVGLGAAICAATALGVHRGWDEAIEQMVGYERPVEPDARRSDLYAELAAVYDLLPALTDPLFARSRQLFG